MRLNSRKLVSLFAGAALALQVALPITAVAQTADPSAAADATSQRNTFCVRLPGLATEIRRRMDEREAKIKARREERKNKLEARLKEANQKRNERQANQDVKRGEFYLKLEQRATTTPQKQAVADFKTTVEAAVAVRRAATDAAITEFLAGSKRAIEERDTQVIEAVKAFRSAVEAAISKAESACASGTDPRTVRETFVADMKTAQEEFQKDKQQIDRAKDEIQALRDKTKNTIEKTHEDFRKTMEQARKDLKAAFDKTK